ncbi:MAG: alpha/beta fold hydrolase [Litorimonas sp.]
MRRFLTVLNVILLFAVLAVGWGLWRGLHLDDRVVFLPVERPDRDVLTIRGEAALGTVRHQIVPLGGHDIALTTVGPDAGPLIVACFGNASDRYEHGADYAAKVGAFGQAVVWDYPGYGDSSGHEGAEAVNAVASDLAAWLEEKAEDRPLVVWGHSLGGFVCANLASRVSRVDAVILETTAPGIQAVADAWTPDWLPLRVTFDEALLAYDIADALSGVEAPVLIIGAGRDRVLPVHLSRQLSAELPEATYLELPEATHFSAGFDPRAQAAVEALLDGL